MPSFYILLAKIIEVTSNVLSNCDTAISEKIYQRNISRFAFLFLFLFIYLFFFFWGYYHKTFNFDKANRLWALSPSILFLSKIFSNVVILNSFGSSQDNSNKIFSALGVKYRFLIIEPIEYQCMCMSITILETAVKSTFQLGFHCCFSWIGKTLSFLLHVL